MQYGDTTVDSLVGTHSVMQYGDTTVQSLVGTTL